MTKKVIVAEDDKAILEVVKIILEGDGYAVFPTDSEEGIHDLIAKYTPDMMLLDIWLAGEDGGKIARKIKTKKETKHIPIVMISANNETEKISKEVGADDFLLKPFDIDDLLKIVKKYTQSTRSKS